MAEYIDREALIKKIRDEGILGSGYSNDEREDDVIDMICSEPVVDVMQMKRGKRHDRMSAGKDGG